MAKLEDQSQANKKNGKQMNRVARKKESLVQKIKVAKPQQPEPQVSRVPPKPKTKKKRAEEARKKAKRIRELKRNTLKKQQSQVEKAPFIVGRLEKAEKLRDYVVAKKELCKYINNNYRTKRFTSAMFKEDREHVPKPSDLAGSVREIRPVQTTARDMYKSLERRNMIEVRPSKKKRNKRKLKLIRKRNSRTSVLGK